MAIEMGFEKSVVKSKHLYQLAASKAKDCDRQPTQYVWVRHVDWGRSI